MSMAGALAPAAILPKPENGVQLQLRTRCLDLSTPRVMGVLNCTPDSFSDGGCFLDAGAAIRHARGMLDAGADIIDIGGESTRPGAAPVSVQEELARVIPVVETLVRETGCVVSIDTTKPEVMRAACQAGAELVNDITALRAPGALQAVTQTGAGACLMHMQGVPRNMQEAPHYTDVVGEVKAFFEHRIQACTDAGIERLRLCVDPGFGFGKRLHHNLRLLAQLPVLESLGVPLLVGVSRKSMLGEITGRPTNDRLAASIAAAVLAVERGAAIVRTHDVGATRDALAVVTALVAQKEEQQ